jgi:hypothetical protein
MILQVGDFFEGVYQLSKKMPAEAGIHTARWLADDFSGNQKKQVIIDIYANTYDPKLDWKGNVGGLLKIGQSVSNDLRYFVWSKGQAKALSVLTIGELTDEEREAFIRMIENLSLAPDEMVLPNDTPEYWRSDSGELLLFYRKQVSPYANPKQNAEITHFWKKILAPYYVPPRPEPVVVADQKAAALPSPANPLAWRLGLVAIGAVLAISVYFIKTAYPSDGASETSNLITFNRAIETGMNHEKKGNYDLAVQAFEKAAQLPVSNITQERLDSLGYAYESFAFMECDKYKSLDSSNLYFIADQYFHYASILTGKTPARKCE